MNVKKINCGEIGGQEVLLFEISNDSKTTVCVTNIGATITSIKTADKNNKIGEIVLGFDDPKMYLDEQYIADGYFFGATVGRYANRIANGSFTLGGKTYKLEINNGPNHLHGGSGSFNTKFWSAEEFEAEGRAGVKMSYTSPNMENGYPGELKTTVVFTLNNANELSIDYQAKTDKQTILNLTNHSYFNLRGAGDVLDTKVLMQAKNYTPKDETNIPEGPIESVKGTPLDFTLEHSIGERVNMFEDGYDHNYVIDGIAGELRLAAEAWDEQSGRKLVFKTTEPGFQFYTAYWLKGDFERNGLKFDSYGGFCFEAQHYPDSPNKPTFPSVVLKPGETYTQKTIYKFEVL